MRLTGIAATAFLVFGLAGSAPAQERITLSAQERNQYVVSVRAGGVNLVEGDVTFKGKADEWDLLIAGDTISNGNRVKTGADGRAEILLNPGSYLRLSENTEIVFVNTSLNRLEVVILNGSAYIEAAMAEDQSDVLITVLTPQTEFCVVKGGLYRFNVEEGKRTEALVKKGKLMMPALDGQLAGKKEYVAIPRGASMKLVSAVAVSEGKKVVIDDSQPTILAFNKKDEDEFDLWSKDRAKALLAANRKLTRHASSGLIGWNSWVYNPLFGSFCYLPLYRGIRSPYGGYSVCNNPYAGNRNNGYPGGRGNGSGTGTGGGYGGGVSSGGNRGAGGGYGGGVSGGATRSGGSVGSSGGGTGGARGGGMDSAPTSPRGNNRPPR